MQTLASRPALTLEESTFQASDGTALFYRAWRPARPDGTAVLVLHRGHEHSGRMQQVVEGLAQGSTSYFAWDQRGHGRSPGPRAHAENVAQLVADLDAFAEHVTRTEGIPISRMAVVAQSVGAVLAAAWVRERRPPIRGLVLAVPALRVRLYVPFALPLLRLRQRLFGPGVVRSYVKAGMLTHDAEQAALYKADPLVFPQIPVHILLDLFDTSCRVLEDAGRIEVPTLVLVAGADRVVRQSTQRKFFDALGSQDKHLVEYPGFYHAIYHEKGREQPIAETRRFLSRVLGQGADLDP